MCMHNTKWTLEKNCRKQDPILNCRKLVFLIMTRLREKKTLKFMNKHFKSKKFSSNLKEL